MVVFEYKDASNINCLFKICIENLNVSFRRSCGIEIHVSSAGPPRSFWRPPRGFWRPPRGFWRPWANIYTGPHKSHFTGSSDRLDIIDTKDLL